MGACASWRPGNPTWRAATSLSRRRCNGTTGPGGTRPKVLLVSPFLPYPLSHGGAVRIYNLCRALGSRVDFILVAMRESHEAVDYAKLHEVFRQVSVVDRDEKPCKEGGLPGQVRQYQSRSMRALIAELARRWKPDALQIEYTHMAGFRDAAPEIPAVLVEHDLTFSLYRQLAEQNPSDRAARREYQRWLAFERHWLKKFDAVWTVSEEDRRAAIGAGERNPQLTYAIANGVDLDRFQPCPQDDGAASGGSIRRIVPPLTQLPGLREVADRDHAPAVEAFPRTAAAGCGGTTARSFPEAICAARWPKRAAFRASS